jgi:hypothetical protein
MKLHLSKKKKSEKRKSIHRTFTSKPLEFKIVGIKLKKFLTISYIQIRSLVPQLEESISNLIALIIHKI